MTMTVKSNGVFTGSVKVNGTSGGFGGTLDVNGNATVTTVTNEANLNLSLHLDETGTKTVTGIVTNTVDGWNAAVTNDLAIYATSAYPTPDRFSAAISAAGVTTGYGYLSITNGTNGISSIAGKLADKTTLSGTFAISKDGRIAVYQSLYNNKGLYHGYLTFAENNVSGNVTWLRPDNASSDVALTTYPQGITNVTLVDGSPYVPADFVTDFRTLTITGLDDAPDITYFVRITGMTNLVKYTNSIPTNGFTGSIERKTGIVTLSYRPTGYLTNKTGFGIFFQSNTNAYGAVLGTTNVGLLHIYNP